jgi:hypothetical protein
MDGKKSIKEWEIDMEIKNTPRNSGEKDLRRKVEKAKRNAPTVLTWIPGIIPVTTPHKTPIRHANNRSKIQSPIIIYNKLLIILSDQKVLIIIIKK